MATKKSGVPGGQHAAKTNQETPASTTSTTSLAANNDAVGKPGLGAAARAYAALGWRVFPCRGKVPAIAGGHGLHDATTSPAKLAEWWPGGVGSHNIGGRPPAGKFVVDIDIHKDPAKLQPFADMLIATGAPWQRTGRGVHIVFDGDAPRASTLKKKVGVADGIEVITHASGYIILGPSKHPETGKTYTWHRPLMRVGPTLPDGLRVNVGPYKPAEDDKEPLGLTIDQLREMAGYLPWSTWDNYSDWINIGMAIHHETGGSPEGEALYDELSQRAPEKYKDDPGAPAAKFATFGSYDGLMVTMRSYVSDARKLGYVPPATIEGAMDEFTAAGFLADASARRFDLTRAAPVQEFVFAGTLPAGSLAVLAGEGGVSKSFLAMTLAVNYPIERAFGGFFTPTLRGRDDEALVLFAEEDEKQIEIRFRAVLDAAGLEPAQVVQVQRRVHLKSLMKYEYDFKLASYEDRSRRVVEGPLLETLRRVLLGRPMIRFVVLDPLVLLSSLEENDNDGMGRLMGMLNTLASQTGASIVIAHHLSKTGAQADELNASSVRGASAITANARTLLLLQKADTPGDVKVSLAKHNYSRGRDDFIFRISPRSGAVELIDGPQPEQVPPTMRKEAKRQADREKVADIKQGKCLRALLDLIVRSPMGWNALELAKPGGATRGVLKATLADAERDGLLTIETGANRTKLYTITKHGRDVQASAAM